MTTLTGCLNFSCDFTGDKYIKVLYTLLVVASKGI